MFGMFSVPGDSMIFVNKHGRRVVNEKMKYNELAKTFFQWDGAAGEYPNLVLVQIWDQRSQEYSARTAGGSLIVPPGVDDSHVIRGETPESLTEGIRERLARYVAHTGGLSLAEDFLTNLCATIDRFNRMAERGVDEDFHRGEAPIQLEFNGAVKDEPGRKNPTMWTISGSGPYYAALVIGGTRWTPRAAPARTRTGRYWMTSANRFQACTRWATAPHRCRRWRTGRVEPRSARSWHSPIARPTERTRSRPPGHSRWPAAVQGTDRKKG